MPAYHATKNDQSLRQLCGVAVLPLRTQIRGPAPPMPGGETEDFLDEVLSFFKANVLFRNFEVQGPGDRLLIYTTLYITSCLVALEKCPNKTEALKLMNKLALDNFAIPGDAGFALAGVLPNPKDRTEADAFRAYIRQVREETGIRVAERCFPGDGSKGNKWWLCFSKRKFLNKSLK